MKHRYWEDPHWKHLYRGNLKNDKKVVLAQLRHGEWDDPPHSYSIELLDDLIELSKQEVIKRILKHG